MKQTVQTSAPLRLAAGAENDLRDNRFKKLSRNQLINLLNRIHFADGEINLHFRHPKYQSPLVLKARPQVCKDSQLRCEWKESPPPLKKISTYAFENFTFSDGLREIQVSANLLIFNGTGIELELPENCFETANREIKRYDCKGISAQISQDGWVASGMLINFTIQSLVIEFNHNSSLLKNEIEAKQKVYLVLKNDDEFIFSGSCRIVRQERSQYMKVLVLKPLTESIKRLKAKGFRSERITLHPLPSIIFTHPLIKKKFHLEINDISGLGFSVEEIPSNSVLLPGMIIPDMEILFMHGFSVHCKSQVLYRRARGEVVRCGLVILDMNMHDYLKLASLIHQAKNKHSFINPVDVDFEALWDFFFESGFIYPEKYYNIVEQKDELTETFNKIYKGHPEIAQYITFEDKGKIFGHISIHRYYQKTWLLHHLAAIKSPKHKAGLVVLEHIFKHINEMHSLPSARMEYLAGYFRPDNRFSKRLFGPNTVQTIDDLNKCSVDEFAYCHITFQSNQTDPINSWVFGESNDEDILIFNQWYDKVSGGLLVRALDLAPESYYMDKDTSDEYRASGFKRERTLYSLKKDDELVAVLVINISDFGLNMSDLTNCIQVFVIDREQLDQKAFQFFIQKLAGIYEQQSVPVLIYPIECADQAGLSQNKSYMLGILNLEFIDDYLEFKHSLIYSQKTIALRQVH